jgi:hypothetical protein
MKIAGKQTDAPWTSLKTRLQADPPPHLWASAFRRFHRARIDTRYMMPIASIRKADRQIGEGFVMVALFCTLVEYLESCERGYNFRFVPKRNSPMGPYEYNRYEASGYFKDFLRTRKPFVTLVPSALVDSFYRDVRCGLLHEARTKGGWTVSTRQSGGQLVSQGAGKVTLFRNELIPALETYCADYRSRLLSDQNTQAAFIRKFDHLCIP